MDTPNDRVMSGNTNRVHWLLWVTPELCFGMSRCPNWFIRTFQHWFLGFRWESTLNDKPAKCKKHVKQYDTSCILLSNPPKVRWTCERCSTVGFDKWPAPN